MADRKNKRTPGVAGLALIAADTGRVLMLQRSFDDPKDPARGTWEFPGGHLEDGDATTLHGAMREWSEEVGHAVPTGGIDQESWTSPNGVYQGHVVVIPAESALDLSASREVVNPDDDHEQVAWWTIDNARRNPALRQECRTIPWAALRRSLDASREVMGIEEKGTGVAGIEEKTKVASEAGERRYGLPIGTELGQARNQQAREAQDAPGARQAYAELIRTNPRDYQRKLDSLPPEELQRLARVAYSSRSSNATVVQARLAVAAALRRKGMDVNDYGGLGKSSTTGRAGGSTAGRGGAGSARRAATPAKYRGQASVNADESLPESDRQALLAAGWKGRAGDGAERLYPPTPSGARTPRGGSAAKKDPTWVGKEDWQARRTRRTKLGLMGVRGSRPPSAPTKKGEGGQVMRLHVYPDGSWQYKGAAPDVEVSPLGYIEVKGGPPPWVKNKDEGGSSGGDKGGTEGAAVKTVGDLASAVKKAKKISDADEREARMKVLRAAARRIGGPAVHMVPGADDSGGKGKGGGRNGNLAPPFKKKGSKSLFDDGDIEYAVHQAAAIECKVMSPDPRAAKLREYWAHGKGRSKWRPGTPGDFERLRKHLRKYVPAKMLNGLTANIHKLATGEWPGKRAHGGKVLHLDGAQVKDGMAVLDAGDVAEASAIDPLDQATDDDAVSLALDHYAQMLDELTPEEEYERALAEEIDWDLLADGTVERADGQDDDTPDARDDDAEDDRAEDDPERMLDMFEAAFA